MVCGISSIRPSTFHRQESARFLSILFAVLLCTSALSGAAFGATAQEEAMLLEAAKPVIENLQQVYVVHDVVLTDIFLATTPLGTALYGTVDLSMTLKAQSVDEMTIFQGILQQTDFPSVCDVKATDFRLLLQTERGAFLRESNPAADEALLSAYAAEALREMVDNYASYIGYRSDFSFPICVALDEGGGVEGCYADLNGTRRNLNIYFLSSREEIAQRGLQELLSIIAYKLPTVKLSDMAKPPYVCAGVRDYAARPFVAAQSRTRRTTPFAYNPYLQYHCHRACADFLSQAPRAEEISANERFCSRAA